MVDVKARHASDVRRCVEEILLRSFAVEAYGHKIAFVLVHHQFEIVVRQVVFSLKTSTLKNREKNENGTLAKLLDSKLTKFSGIFWFNVVFFCSQIRNLYSLTWNIPSINSVT